jgi:DNA helicase-2/ATP-dependent DNA helicase PcrA
MSLEYKNIVSFVDDITLDSLTEETSDDDTLIITTVHSAKGLEWKVVFMIDCCEGAFPARIDPTEYGTPADEEELRCFYVALTRAKDNLYVIAPMYKMIGGGTERVSKSHYLIRTESFFK